MSAAAGEETARLPTRLWATFSFHPFGVPPLAADGSSGVVQTYTLEDVVVIRGAALPDVRPGWTVTRAEGRAPTPPAASGPALVGTTQHLGYTAEAQQAELAAISNPGSGPIAVLIPIAKSEAWWAQPHDRRQAHFRPHPEGRLPGHTAIGAAYAARIFRRLYHARYLPGSDWDFITYFEMEERHVPDFRALLAELRDPDRNPEWTFVTRELELWMRRA